MWTVRTTACNFDAKDRCSAVIGRWTDRQTVHDTLFGLHEGGLHSNEVSHPVCLLGPLRIVIFMSWSFRTKRAIFSLIVLECHCWTNVYCVCVCVCVVVFRVSDLDLWPLSGNGKWLPDFIERLKASAWHQLYLPLLPFTHARSEPQICQIWRFYGSRISSNRRGGRKGCST